MVRQFLRDKVPFGDFFFLFLQVSGHLNQFHSVEQRTGNSIQTVGRRNKEHVAQVIIHVQIIVMESAVLFRIEHFQKCGCRVTFVVSADLIHFIENENRVGSAAFLDIVNDASGQGTHVGATVSAYLRFVMQTA